MTIAALRAFRPPCVTLFSSYVHYITSLALSIMGEMTLAMPILATVRRAFNLCLYMAGRNKVISQTS